MAIRLHEYTAAALLCAGLAAPSLAQPNAGNVPELSAPLNAPATVAGPAGVPELPAIAPAKPDTVAPVPPTVPGPELVGPAPEGTPATEPSTLPAPAATDTSEDHSANGLFGLDLKNTSTKASGLSRTAKARVNNDEQRITAELNRASAASTGNANPAIRASTSNSAPTSTQ